MNVFNAMKKLAFGVALIGLFAWNASAIVAYNTPTTTPGNQSDGPYSFGMAFLVNSAITVSSLGLFDAGQDGISGSVLVGIYNAGSQTLVGSGVTFSGTSDPLLSGSAYRFQSVGPFQLGAGIYEIVAYSLGGTANPAYNAGAGAGSSLITTDSGGGVLTFLGNFHNAPGSFPSDGTFDGTDPDGQYGAGSFQYTVGITPVPEVAVYGSVSAALLGLIYVGRFRSAKAQDGLIF